MPRIAVGIAVLLCSCHATVRPIVGAPAGAAYRDPATGVEYAEPCNPDSFQLRDGGLVLLGTGVVLGGTAGIVGSNWIGLSERRHDAKKPLTAAVLGGSLLAAGGGVLIHFDDSPHAVCALPEDPAGE